MNESNYWPGQLRRRLSRRQALISAGAVTASAAFLAACGGSADSQPGGSKGDLLTKPTDTLSQAKRGGVMKDRNFGDPATLDILTPQNPTAPVSTHVYSTLVRFKPGYMEASKNEINPDIAESWETSPDGLEIVLKIRQNAKWHNKAPVNGRPFDMEDLLFSWNRFATKATQRGTIANSASPNGPVLSFTSPDSRTVVMKLKEPLVYVLGLLTSLVGVIMLPKEADRAYDPKNEMIGTGPFMLSSHTPSVGFTFKRHSEYWEQDYALVDQVEMPVIPEYATALGQFKTGNIYTMGSYTSTSGVAQADVTTLKREEPRLSIYQDDLQHASLVKVLTPGWLPAGKSPFLDERVRQAMSMSWERDLYLDTFHNISKFESEGLPVVRRWNTALAGTGFDGWLDPQGKDFGPNAKYFKYDLAEAKKLLAAAGFPNGFETKSNYITGAELGVAPKQAAVLDGFMRELGIKMTVNPIDYAKEYIPQYRDGRGQHEGWTYKSTAGNPTAGSAIAALANEYWSKAGVSFQGFTTNMSNDQAGDPQIDSMIEKARVERDEDRRRSLVYDIQRNLAKSMYALPLPGVASGFVMAWPCIGNFRVWSGAKSNYRLWVDSTKAPFKS